MDQTAAARTVWFRRCAIFLCVLTLLYAAVAGLKTVVDFDLGWQIALGRSLVKHHAAARTVFSAYTLPAGAVWIYPQLSCLLFYAIFQASGYTGISILCCAATVFCAFCLAWRRGLLAQLVALIAVAVLASEIMPRASLFSMLLIAAMGRMLAAYQQGRRVPLWMLPLLMILWVNLHLGFLAGVALLFAYAFIELGECLSAKRRAAARNRLRAAAPWLLLCLPAILVNPFGIGVLRDIARQQGAVAWQTVLLEEWQPLQLHLMPVQLGWRNTQSSLWWLLLFACVLFAGLLWKRRFAPALVIAAACAAVFRHHRMEGPAILVLCLIAGPALDAVERQLRDRPGKPESKPAWKPVLVVCVALATLFASVRMADALTNRASLREVQLTRFGTGPSWFLPLRAAQFLRQKQAMLQGNLFAPFSLGSFLVQQQIPVFADGRSVPFGQSLLEQQQQLASTPLDDPAWQQAADRYRISAVLFPLAHVDALNAVPLQQDCASTQWAPVFFDDASILFLRRTADNAGLIAQSGLDCRTYMLPASADASPLDRYEHAVNAAGIYLALNRAADATAAIAQAQSITQQDDPSLLLLEAQVAASADPLAAEAALRRAAEIQPSDGVWFDLAMLLAAQQRYPEAEEAMAHSLSLSLRPWERDETLAVLELRAEQPEPALQSLDRAERASPYGGQQTPAAHAFRAALATDRARAALLEHDVPAALASMRLAVREDPGNLPRRSFLARICTEGHQPCTAQEAQPPAP
ncbi:hypothetical protein [Silvibacterium sp.]|uniref:hypothetical protein n=1 Tax=Silvibacterium sp. TaxID=1964179 RepID=UPI0039E4A235